MWIINLTVMTTHGVHWSTYANDGDVSLESSAY
jgi:hypothetical protein